jgi:hypothetical protein
MDLTSVAVALVMLVDVSGSIDNREYELQRGGIVAAFEDRAVQRAIWQQRAIAVTVIEWSDVQRTVVPWRMIADDDGARRFAAEVALVRRSSAGGTHLGDAIVVGVESFASCGCAPERLVLDVSGDGRSNGGRVTPASAREAAAAREVVINGLPILGDPTEPDLDAYYRDEVVSGGGFAIVARDFHDFARALRQKLAREIAAAAPGPAPWL